MKAIVFDRYLDTLGGGERYSLEFALTLVKLGYSVEVAWTNKETLKKAELRFGLDLSALTIDPKAYSLFFNHSGLIERYHFTHRYDLIFWVSDGSLPFLFGKKNLIHFQTPFKKVSGLYLANILKVLLLKKVIYNSVFTQKVIQNQLPLASGAVLYPPVSVSEFKPAKKQNLILSVARFDSPSHAKRQDILIEAFKLLHKQETSYKLILAGGLVDEVYLSKLKKKAGHLPIEFIANPDFNQLKSLYAQAKFFWHAAGFEIDENTNPEKVEHFGITTVEAMAAGCVPIVIKKGGQKEIITSRSGFLCESPVEMVEKTVELVHNNLALSSFATEAIERSHIYSRDNFHKNVSILIQS